MAPPTCDCLLSDAQMHAQLELGHRFSLMVPQWQEVERQIERLGFGDIYVVTLVNAKRGKITRVTPLASGYVDAFRNAA
jgi:hypothetical protein